MKLLFPFSLALFLVACAPPKPGTTAHQRQLEKEARENFYAMQAQHRKAHPELRTAREEAPAKVRLKPFASEPAPTKRSYQGTVFARPTPTPKRVAAVKVKPTPTPKPHKPSESINPFARYERKRRSDETIYYSDLPRGGEPTSPRYQAYKAKYAHSLAKRPENLTPEEREWVRRHYRD